MSVTVILGAPALTEPPDATAPGLPDAPRRLLTLIQVVPPAKPVATPPVVVVADGDPTWEDAEWQ